MTRGDTEHREPAASAAPPPPPHPPGLPRRAWTFLRTRVLTLDMFHAAHMIITCGMLVFGLGFRIVDNWPHSDTDALVAALGPDATVTVVVPTAAVARSPFTHPLVTVPEAIPRATQLRLRRAISVARLAAADGAHARTGAPVDIVIVGADATEAGAWLAAEYGEDPSPFSTFGAPVKVSAPPLAVNATLSAAEKMKHRERHFCERFVDVSLLSSATDASTLWPQGDDDVDGAASLRRTSDAATAFAGSTTLRLRLRMSARGASTFRRGCSSDVACMRHAAHILAHHDHTGDLGGGSPAASADAIEALAGDASSSIIVSISSWYHLNAARVRYPRWLSRGADMYRHRCNMATMSRIFDGRDPCGEPVNGTVQAFCATRGWAGPPDADDEHRTVELASASDNWLAPSVEDKRRARLFFVEADRDEFEVYVPSQWVRSMTVAPSPRRDSDDGRPPRDDDDDSGANETQAPESRPAASVCRMRPPVRPVILHPNLMAGAVPGWVIDAAHSIALTWALWAEAAWQTVATACCMRVPLFVLSTLIAGNA